VPGGVFSFVAVGLAAVLEVRGGAERVEDELRACRPPLLPEGLAFSLFVSFSWSWEEGPASSGEEEGCSSGSEDGKGAKRRGGGGIVGRVGGGMLGIGKTSCAILSIRTARF
jgi:hypothetical protein